MESKEEGKNKAGKEESSESDEEEDKDEEGEDEKGKDAEKDSDGFEYDARIKFQETNLVKVAEDINRESVEKD